MKSRLWWLCCVVGVLLWSPSAHAQGLLDGLIGKPSKQLNIRTPEVQQQARWQKRYKQIREEMSKNRKRAKARKEVLKQQKEKLQKELMAFVARPFLGGPKQLQTWTRLRKQNTELLRGTLQLYSQIASARSSLSESRRALRDVLRALLENTPKKLQKQLERNYIQTKSLVALEQSLLRLDDRLQKSKGALIKDRETLRELIQDQERSQVAFDEARKRLVREQKPMLPPSVPKTPASRPALNKAQRQAMRRPTSRPSPGPPQREAVGKRQLQRMRQQRLEWTFTLFRERLRWLRTRIRDERLNVEVSQLRLKLYYSIRKEFTSARKQLLANTSEGIWFYRSLRFDTKLLKATQKRLQKLLKEEPGTFVKVLQKRQAELRKRSTSQQVGFVFLLLILVVFLFFFTRAMKRRLLESIQALTQRIKDESATAQLWLLIRLGLLCLLRVQRTLLGWMLLVGLCWSLGFPLDWIMTLLVIGGLWVGFVLYWTIVSGLFAKETSERFFPIDQPSAKNFRRTLKGFGWVLVLYTPILYAAHLFLFPDGMIQWMQVLFYGIFLVAFLLLLLNKDGILSMIPMDHIVGRVLILFLHRFYPFLFVFVVGLFTIYVYGYINLAGYLTQGCCLSVLLIAGAAGLYRLAWMVGLWAFGFTRSAKGLVQVEKRWAKNLLRLYYGLIGGVLAVLSIGLLLEIWRFGEGLSTLFRLLTTPFLQVKDTQINILSLGRFVFPFGVAIWLSGWLRQKSSEYLYPALRMSQANQYAANTVLGYVIVAVGALSGLQWMGIGMEFLAVFAGVIGIGIGFGMQNVVSNFISGLIVTFGQPIKVGDLIEVADMMGVVKEISGRSTTIETHDGRIVLVPNSEVLTKKLINWSKGPPWVKAELKVGVAYHSDMRHVFRLLQEIAEAHPLVLSDPAVTLRLGAFGASSLDVSVWIAVEDPTRRFEALSDLRMNVTERFREESIEISFPQQDVHLDESLQEAIIENLKALSAKEPPKEPSHSK